MIYRFRFFTDAVKILFIAGGHNLAEKCGFQSVSLLFQSSIEYASWVLN